MSGEAGAGRAIRFTVNGKLASVTAPAIRRLAYALRDELGLTGTKIGCDAGDCGACTVLLDGAQVCACMVPVGQVEGRAVTTVEGLAPAGRLNDLQRAFLRHGAAQCGICTPGMLIAATDLLARSAAPDRREVEDALGGVLCRCTGYRKIVDAVLDVTAEDRLMPSAGAAVGSALVRLDGPPKVDGREIYGADAIPADALRLKVIRSPHAAAMFTIGTLDDLLAKNPGIKAALTAADVPFNGFGIYPDLKDQPVLADGIVRYRGDPVLALVGEAAAIEALRTEDVPINYTPLAPVTGLDAAMAPGARAVHDARPDNLLIAGVVERGDVEAAFAEAAAVAAGRFETSFVEHAYIEPEAGWARLDGERIVIHASTQAPYMDRDETANVLRIAPDRVRVVPTACGGGFGGKLDVSVQPLLALAALKTGRTVGWVYHRPESMAASTKRHPGRIDARFACDRAGRLTAAAVDAAFNTGAYASWGPTVAGRVPVHAAGPYRVANVANRGRAYYTNEPPAGAFRGFGVPQAAIAHEALLDELAEAVGLDRLEIRLINAIRVGDETACGHRLSASAGLMACLEALKPRWDEALAAAAAGNGTPGPVRRGVGIGCMWYGIGNTSMSNPSTIRIGLGRDGTVTLYNGAVDIGQGSNTVLAQIAADAAGLPVDRFHIVMGDTDRTADAGKTSASRQTFVSGKAAERAGIALRRNVLRHVNAGEDARLELDGGNLYVRDRDVVHQLDLGELSGDGNGDVMTGEGTFDPPTEPLDENGQGVPYATYGFAAQIAELAVDVELGTVKLIRISAAHDVGRAINPTLVEGQIEGGIAQGIGFALMEEYLPGRTENLHDYLIPTFGDVPDIDITIIEDPEPLGPYGAKGVGEPGLVPTAPAILNAIRHATGVAPRKVPVLPHRLSAAIAAKENRHD